MRDRTQVTHLVSGGESRGWNLGLWPHRLVLPPYKSMRIRKEQLVESASPKTVKLPCEQWSRGLRSKRTSSFTSQVRRKEQRAREKREVEGTNDP